MSPTRSTALAPLFDDIRSRLDRAADLAARLEQPNLPTTRESAHLFRDCLRELSALSQLDPPMASAVEIAALYHSFDAFQAFRAGASDLTASSLIDLWASALTDLRGTEQLPAESVSFVSLLEAEIEATFADLGERLSRLPTASLAPPQHAEWLVLFHQALEQVVAPELATDQARSALRGLITRLELSQGDLGRMLGVSGETIRRWERGSSGIPVEHRAGILAAEPALRRLQDLFRPERLPAVIRRPAELFDGESALDWILHGRIADVADRYEETLLYQA